MSNYALTTDGTPLPAVERKIRKYLPGLDVRLFPYSATQAILREHLVRALELDYPHIAARALLRAMGIADVRAVSDEATALLIEHRDVDQLPSRRVEAITSAITGVDWHLALVRVPPAWSRVGGPDAIAWGEVKVGLIGTGYTMHPSLGFPSQTWLDIANARTFSPPVPAGEAGMLLADAGPGIDNLGGFSGGHGTRMAATISGHAPAAPGGPYFGVAPKVPLVPVRITDSVWINHAQREFQQAVEHLVGTAAVKVINVSLGVFFGTVVGAMKSAVNTAYEAGVIMVCAAGNEVNQVVAPAALSRTLAVAGVNQRMEPWSGSSYGPEVDFSAPAVNIRRASTEGFGRFVYGAGGDGTSYATAITSGAAALWLAHHGPALAAAYPQPWQRVEAFRRLARDTTQRPARWNPGAFGTGVLDVDALLAQPLPAAGTLTELPRA